MGRTAKKVILSEEEKIELISWALLHGSCRVDLNA